MGWLSRESRGVAGWILLLCGQSRHWIESIAIYRGKATYNTLKDHVIINKNRSYPFLANRW